jgi:hypothetical protein
MVGETPDEQRLRPLSNNLRDDRLPRAEYFDLAMWHGFKVDFKVGFTVILVSETRSPQGGLRRMDTVSLEILTCTLGARPSAELRNMPPAVI